MIRQTGHKEIHGKLGQAAFSSGRSLQTPFWAANTGTFRCGGTIRSRALAIYTRWPTRPDVAETNETDNTAHTVMTGINETPLADAGEDLLIFAGETAA